MEQMAIRYVVIFIALLVTISGGAITAGYTLTK